MSVRIAQQQEELAKLIERYSSRDGVHKTAVPSLFSSVNLMLPNRFIAFTSRHFVLSFKVKKKYCLQRSALGTVLLTTLWHLLTCRLPGK